MPEPQLKKFGHLTTAHLEPGEQLLDIAVVQPLRGASGGVGVTGVIGSAIASVGAVKGGKGTIADSFPHDLPLGTNMLTVTDRRVLFLYTGAARNTAQPLWGVPRSAVLGVERRPRLQVMAKFRLHFEDGSSVSILTMRRRSIDSLTAVIGSARRQK
jgi:hypothetical protein